MARYDTRSTSLSPHYLRYIRYDTMKRSPTMVVFLGGYCRVRVMSRPPSCSLSSSSAEKIKPSLFLILGLHCMPPIDLDVHVSTNLNLPLPLWLHAGFLPFFIPLPPYFTYTACDIYIMSKSPRQCCRYLRCVRNVQTPMPAVLPYKFLSQCTSVSELL